MTQVIHSLLLILSCTYMKETPTPQPTPRPQRRPFPRPPPIVLPWNGASPSSHSWRGKQRATDCLGLSCKVGGAAARRGGSVSSERMRGSRVGKGWEVFSIQDIFLSRPLNSMIHLLSMLYVIQLFDVFINSNSVQLCIYLLMRLRESRLLVLYGHRRE